DKHDVVAPLAPKATKNAEVKSRNIIKKFQEELNDIIKNDPVIYLNTAQKPIYYVQTTFEPELILDKVVDAENEERAIKSVIETRYESRSLIEVDAKQIRKGFLFLHPKYHVHLKYPARVGGQVRMPGVYKLEIGTELREWYTSKCSELNVGNYISMSLRGTARFRTEEYNFEQIIEKLIEMHKINIGDATRPIESAYINFSKTAFRARLSYYYAYQVIRISTNRYQLMEEWDDGDGY
ncbi:MAG TPA: hypothetical protein PK530_12445, partial [Anaerolineales bacterium]|nr:hypothetical protein [Anaerolineales bacterium]